MKISENISSAFSRSTTITFYLRPLAPGFFRSPPREVFASGTRNGPEDLHPVTIAGAWSCTGLNACNSFFRDDRKRFCRTRHRRYFPGNQKQKKTWSLFRNFETAGRKPTMPSKYSSTGHYRLAISFIQLFERFRSAFF